MPYGKLLRTFPQGLENGAPAPFPTAPTATTTIGYSCCLPNRVRSGLVRGVIRVEKPGEPGELKRLKERVRQLETALADAHMDCALDQSFFEILCDEQGIDPEAFKKKHGGEASSRRGRRSRGLQG